ncbi:hypothetical protein [Rhizorhapis sp.]|uniref:hypothetical protein n=1 Tax=Rhizorhapis sp. TaxID=1968842 RepID=UPI002B4827A6|nr:hypothetical protein [Rhizorhapis sp.]HKR17820.1 hypothetical protein [Rhizorhapis sp.]
MTIGSTRDRLLRVLDIAPEKTGADFDAVFENIGGKEAHVGETMVKAGSVVVQRGTAGPYRHGTGRRHIDEP